MSPDLLQSLREFMLVATAPRGRRAALARAMGVGQGYINQWLDYKELNPGVNDLPAIAAFVGLSLSDFIRAVDGSATMTLPDTPPGVDSASQVISGSASDEVTARLLREENAQLRRRVKALADSFRHTTDELAELAVGSGLASGPRPARKPKPRPR